MARFCRVILAAFLVSGCGDDDPVTPPPGGGCADAAIDTTGCAAVLRPSGADDVEAVQTALIEAQSGSDVCFCPGTYAFEREISLTVPDVTVRGLGATRDDVILDFATQMFGDDGFTVTSDGFTIERLSIKNSPGNGIVVTDAEDVTFRDLHVSWDAGSVTENGAYAVYPVKSTRVIVEDSEVVGAADAGIYVGQCEQIIVRNNVVHGNVAGIEIENSLDADVYENEAYDNTAGILVFVLPNLDKKEGARSKVHDNQVHDNGRENFAEAGTIVASVPPGFGFLVVGNDDVEIHDNVIENNPSAGVVLVSYDLLQYLGVPPSDDPETDRYSLGLHVHDNTFSGNGTDPQGTVNQLDVTPPLEDVIWDGIVDPADMDPADPPVLCLGDSPASFRNLNAPDGLFDAMLQSTDTTPHACTLPSLDSVSW